jgi:hypothetical protein
MVSYINWEDFVNYNDWKNRTTFYGSAIRISRKLLILSVTVFCILTPFTNWLIPIVPKAIKKDIIIRRKD